MVVPVIRVCSGTINGSNLIFKTPAPYVPGTLRVFVNGQLLRSDFDDGWTELGGDTFRLKEAPIVEDTISAYFVPL